MTAIHARAARRERQAAAAVGSTRVRRARGESAPDVEPIRLPSGVVIVPEAKSRKRAPKVLERWMQQAEGYAPPGAVGAVFVYPLGGRACDALVILRVSSFRLVAGLDAPPVQLSLFTTVKP